MEIKRSFSDNNFAPCGLICNLCYAYQRSKNNCLGCRNENPGKFKYCIKCYFKNCEQLLDTPNKICSECNKYPCSKLKTFIKRYLIKYNYNIKEKFDLANKVGIKDFLQQEYEKWVCESCKAVLCIHSKKCENCGKQRNL
ncbi:MAG TPA: DUF3795 domain-containing protein [Melioribacteraceae bacterium]|nr:DUF3795 domain-containing protein [Melioribacteraceae bacterium]